MTTSDHYDVIVAGSGPAGSTAAIMLGRQGLRVALLEAHRDMAFYKRMCTHFIQSSALPTLARLGVDDLIESAGGLRNRHNFWSPYGWAPEPEPVGRPAYGYNILRLTLDPLIRSVAQQVPTVDLRLGAKVRGLTHDRHGRAQGVVVDDGGETRHLTARLIIGADGRSSQVADAASLPSMTFRSKRFGYFASFRNVTLPEGQTVQLWLDQPDAVYAFANDDDVTVLGVIAGKSRLPEFEDDRERAILAKFGEVPNAPDLTAAVRVSSVVGSKDYPSIVRRRITRPGVALIGDAALVADPLWGIGCGWAFQSAEWLSEAVTDPLRAGTNADIDSALRRYQRRHRINLLPHQLMAIDFSRRTHFTPIERLLFAGAANDSEIADAIYGYVTRNHSPAVLLKPSTLARAIRSHRAVARVKRTNHPHTRTDGAAPPQRKQGNHDEHCQ
jgi:menaquinone-9 beta-reductase